MSLDNFNAHCAKCRVGPGNRCPFDVSQPQAARRTRDFVDACLTSIAPTGSSDRRSAREIIDEGLAHWLPIDSLESSPLLLTVLWLADQETALQLLAAPNSPDPRCHTQDGASAQAAWVAACLGMTRVLDVLRRRKGALGGFVDAQYRHTVLHALACDSVFLSAFSTRAGPTTPCLPADHEDRAKYIQVIARSEPSLLELRDERGCTPLEHAMRHGSVKCALALIATGARIPSRARGQWLACDRALRASTNPLSAAAGSSSSSQQHAYRASAAATDSSDDERNAGDDGRSVNPGIGVSNSHGSINSLPMSGLLQTESTTPSNQSSSNTANASSSRNQPESGSSSKQTHNPKPSSFATKAQPIPGAAFNDGGDVDSGEDSEGPSDDDGTGMDAAGAAGQSGYIPASLLTKYPIGSPQYYAVKHANKLKRRMLHAVERAAQEKGLLWTMDDVVCTGVYPHEAGINKWGVARAAFMLTCVFTGFRYFTVNKERAVAAKQAERALMEAERAARQAAAAAAAGGAASGSSGLPNASSSSWSITDDEGSAAVHGVDSAASAVSAKAGVVQMVGVPSASSLGIDGGVLLTTTSAGASSAATLESHPSFAAAGEL